MRTRTLLGLLTLTTSLVGPLAAAEVPERTTIVSRDGGVVMEAAPPDDARLAAESPAIFEATVPPQYATEDKARYQTIFAQHRGAVAAPAAR